MKPDKLEKNGMVECELCYAAHGGKCNAKICLVGHPEPDATELKLITRLEKFR